jgi:hypothetical protein
MIIRKGKEFMFWNNCLILGMLQFLKLLSNLLNEMSLAFLMILRMKC